MQEKDKNQSGTIHMEQILEIFRSYKARIKKAKTKMPERTKGQSIKGALT